MHQRISPIRKLESLLILLLLAGLLSLAFYDVVFQGRTFKVSTAVSQALDTGVYGQEDNKPAFTPITQVDSAVLEEPVLEFIKHNLRRGILPLWNPHQACGYPLIAMLETGLFFPLNWIMYTLPNTVSWDVLILARLLLAGFFTVCLMRRWGFSLIPSLCAGIIFMLSGPMVILQWWTADVDLLTPLVLLALERLIRSPGSRQTVFAALCISLTVFAGHPEHIFLVNAFCVLFLVFRLYSLRKTIPLKQIPGPLLLSYLTGFGLGAVVLFPFISHFHGEFWNGHPDKVGLLCEEIKARWITVGLPNFFQAIPLTKEWKPAGWNGAYLGLLPIGLTFLSSFSRQKKGLNIFFTVCGLILLAKQYGVPGINALGHLPLFSRCRFSYHTPVFVAFCFALTGGMGVRLVMARRKNILKGLLFCGLAGLTIGIHLLIYRHAEHGDLSLKAARFAFLILAGFMAVILIRYVLPSRPRAAGVLLTALIFVELFSYIYRVRPERFNSFPEVPYIEFIRSSPQRARSYGLLWSFFPNTATGYDIDDLGIFSGLIPLRFVDFVNTCLKPGTFVNDLRPTTLRSAMPQGRQALLDVLNVEYLIVSPERSPPKEFQEVENLRLAYNGEVQVFERRGVLPRAFVVHRIVYEDNPARALQQVKHLGPGLKNTAVIQASPQPEVIRFLETGPVSDDSSAAITRYEANQVELKAAIKHAGFLVLSDAYHPDWKVFVNGKEKNLYQTDYLLRSVFLPAGEHRVRFVFQPGSFLWGCGVSLLSLLALVFLWVRNPRRSPQTSVPRRNPDCSKSASRQRPSQSRKKKRAHSTKKATSN